MNDQYTVLTPEKVAVSFPIASIGSRLVAQLVDIVILVASTTGIAMLVGLILSLISFELATGMEIFLISAWMFLYFIVFEWLWNGRTPGKAAMNIKVVSHDGTPVTLRGAVYRNFMRIADFLPTFYFAGFVACFMNERSQRLGDLVAGTLVIHEPKTSPTYAMTPHHAGIHPLEESVGQLNTMTMEEYFTIKRLCDRFPELPPTVQVRSVEEIWRPFAEKEGIQPLPNVHPVYQMEAVVMRYGRQRKLF
ncbi:MAG TPA: RDD family protein [Fimbriimonadaceae bacterium]|nr:RDD family protein [Fimbriimonadaceae bacterium]